MQKEAKETRRRTAATPRESRPTTPAEASAGGGPSPPPSTGHPADSDALPPETSRDDFKMELINSISTIFKTELHHALGENLKSMKLELQAVKAELASSITSIQSDVATLKLTVDEVETTLSTCTDDISHLQAQVILMSDELIRLENRCEDLESRSRRNNVRIVGVPEDSAAASSTEAVAALLMTAFKLQKEPLLDRWHRTLKAKPRPNETPRPIVVRLHYHQDCVDILKQARTLQRIKIQDMVISVFPDYTAKVARARAAFKDVRRHLYELKLPGLRFGLVFPACLKVTYNNVQKEFKKPEDAETYIKTLGK